VFRSVQEQSYPIYRHELDQFYIYYNSSAQALIIGGLNSQGLLKVHRNSHMLVSSDTDYSQGSLFVFSAWKQWDPHGRFRDNYRMSRVRLQCVDKEFGFCSSGHLYPSKLSMASAVHVVGSQPSENVNFGQVYFRLLHDVFSDLRPVYEMVQESDNATAGNRSVRWYLFHKRGEWRVAARIGDNSVTSGILLRLRGTAMRVEYENGTGWRWVDTSRLSPTHTTGPEFGRLLCRRHLPDGINCQTAGGVACNNDGSCRTDSDGVSSCVCPAVYRGIQCEHRVSECSESFRAPRLTSVLGHQREHYDGSIITVFCLWGTGEVHHAICQNGTWQSTDRINCELTTPVTTSTLAAPTRIWSTLPVDHTDVLLRTPKNSTITITTVIVALVFVQLGLPLVCYCCIACCRDDDEWSAEEVPAEGDQKGEKRKRNTSLQRTCSGFFYVCWWAWLLFIIIYFASHGYIPLDGSSVWSAVAIMAFVCLGVLYCCVFSESFCSREYSYLTKLENEDVTAGEQITEMKAAKPTITFKAECSHNETKTRTVQ